MLSSESCFRARVRVGVRLEASLTTLHPSQVRRARCLGCLGHIALDRTTMSYVALFR